MEYIYVNVGEHVDIKLEVQEVSMLSGGPEVCDPSEEYSTSSVRFYIDACVNYSCYYTNLQIQIGLNFASMT